MQFLAAAAILATANLLPLSADPVTASDSLLQPGNLLLSRSTYAGNSSTVSIGQPLPPNCKNTQADPSNCVAATNDGTYPTVFNNALTDGSFGITSPIFLDEIDQGGSLLRTVSVPDNSAFGDYLVTSFSSKSEIGLHLSTDSKYVTFMGYVTSVNGIDISNSNTPEAIDRTNPVGENAYRAVARMDANGHFTFTLTNAYSGNNGRSAILGRSNGSEFYYTAGNAGNGNNPQPLGVILGAGAQIITPSDLPESARKPGTPTPVASFNINQIDASLSDKLGKDDNFRGLTIYNHTLYFSKGSGGNGVNTVYFLDTNEGACTQVGSGGTGLPGTSMSLPAKGLSYDPATVEKTGLPSNLCILKGFPAVPNSLNATPAYPFGLWFANATTLYVADEGDGFASDATLYTHAKAQTTAGLQKWTFDAGSQQWKLAYVLQNGLQLGQPYKISGYPTGENAQNANVPYAPATDGLRNITGKVNADGTVTIWAVTSTVSGSGDQGADPNRLVKISDVLLNTGSAVAQNESFAMLRTASYGEVLRGVSFTPGTSTVTPSQIAYPVTSSGLAYNPFQRTYSGTVTVRNNTTKTVSGPVYVQLQGLNGGIMVAGTVLNGGYRSLVVLSAGKSIAPGASVSARILFLDPKNLVISYKPVVAVE